VGLNCICKVENIGDQDGDSYLCDEGYEIRYLHAKWIQEFHFQLKYEGWRQRNGLWYREMTWQFATG